MQVFSVNLGGRKSLVIGTKTVETGIFKQPFSGKVRISEQGLHGDTVADLEHHGSPDQAIYLYSLADYAWWSATLDREMRPGTFGENLTISSFASSSLNIGDRFRINEVLLEITFARIPCAKLTARMGDPIFVKRFMQARRPGVYARVLEGGTLEAGDPVTFLPTRHAHPSVFSLFDLWYAKDRDPDLIRQGLAAPIGERGHAIFADWLEQA